MRRFRNLQTLLITPYEKDIYEALNEMIKATRSIRLLQINSFDFHGAPDNIGYLHHLRYLRYMGSPFTNQLLPRSLSSLYHLQFMICDCPHDLSKNDYYPRDMNKLSNLRYLIFPSINLNFPWIGKLKFLQEVNGFCITNENGYRIEELEHMNELRILVIKNLKEVRDAEEAYKAKLCDKRKLTHLSLYWGIEYFRGQPDDIEVDRTIVGRDLYDKVLDNLQPHNYLKELDIRNYMGSRSAIWINDTHLINNLEKICICGCLEWEILPPFGQLPFLKTLQLENMPKVKRLENKFHGNDARCVFPSLQKLHFANLEALVDWFDASVVDDLFPCLTKLSLHFCSKLQELPFMPPRLETLKINSIGWKTLNCCSKSKSTPLKSLQIRNCSNLIPLKEEVRQESDAMEIFQIILNDLTITDP